MTIKEILPLLERVSRGVAKLFGNNCEVAIHDFTNGFEETIIFIENGHISGRKLGDSISEKALRLLKDNKNSLQDEYNYYSRTSSGRIVKSSTVYIRDENSKIVGMFSINYDVTDLTMAKRAIDNAIVLRDPDPQEEMGTITTNVADLLDKLIEEADAFVGVPVNFMNKRDKIRAIKYLNDSGAFLIKKAGDKVSSHYDISKYTLYNYLNEEI